MHTLATAIRATTVISSEIQLATGETFGRVADVILDKGSDHILFVIVARSGALTATNLYYRVDWSDLNYDQELGAYVLSMTAEALERTQADSSIE